MTFEEALTVVKSREDEVVPARVQIFCAILTGYVSKYGISGLDSDAVRSMNVVATHALHELGREG